MTKDKTPNPKVAINMRVPLDDWGKLADKKQPGESWPVFIARLNEEHTRMAARLSGVGL